MNYIILGHSLEAAGLIMITVPLASIVSANIQSSKLNKANHIPQELKNIVKEHQRMHALWPSKAELVSVIIGFGLQFLGLSVILASDIFTLG